MIQTYELRFYYGKGYPVGFKTWDQAQKWLKDNGFKSALWSRQYQNPDTKVCARLEDSYFRPGEGVVNA